ncbi:MAG TPA: 2TM domain-containing protein [Burkholderiaceae bacterium]|nr:2TM domain-containing protein [Burkholderiaceae bacterium]
MTDPVGGQVEDAALARAQRRLRAEMGFYIHLAVYACIIAFLVFLNMRTGSPWWFFWPAFGWGIGIAVHGLSVFGLNGAARDWKQRRLRELIVEERGRR